MRTLRVYKNACRLWAPETTADEPTYVDIEPRATVECDIVDKIHQFENDTGNHARWLVLGWRVWLQLGWEVRKRDREPIRATHYNGLQIVVDDDDPDVIRCLPDPKHLRYRGGR